MPTTWVCQDSFPVHYQNLPLTLGDQAHHWFCGQPKGSIFAWTEVVIFLSHYSSVVVRPAPAQLLAGTKQAANKSDRAYIDRFDKILHEGDSLEEVTKVVLVISGLNEGTKLWKSMYKN